MSEIKIYDLSDAQYSFRHGRYGGRAGAKDGIIINNEPWIVKYPKSTKDMKGTDLPSYTTSPVSEYLGSHIYELLDIPVHQTILGVRKGRLVVACKDFQKTLGDLAEIRQIKNSILESDDKTIHSSSGDAVSLEELYYHFQNNPLMDRDDLKERFYDCIIVDIFINNNDRNNGNWGLLFNSELGRYDLAPVYDNGNAFTNKADENKLQKKYENDSASVLLGGRTVYNLNEKNLSVKTILSLNNEDIKQSILRNIPKIKAREDDILTLIDSIPSQTYDLPVMSDIMKKVYKKDIRIMTEEILYPRYLELLKGKGQDSPDYDDEEEEERI